MNKYIVALVVYLVVLSYIGYLLTEAEEDVNRLTPDPEVVVLIIRECPAPPAVKDDFYIL